MSKSNNSRTHYLNQSSNLLTNGPFGTSGGGGTGSFSKDSMIKNYNNYVQQQASYMQNTSSLSKSTLSQMDKMRNVRSMTPEKQQNLT